MSTDYISILNDLNNRNDRQRNNRVILVSHPSQNPTNYLRCAKQEPFEEEGRAEGANWFISFDIKRRVTDGWMDQSAVDDTQVCLSDPIWFKTAKGRDVSTGTFTCPFAPSLAPLTLSLAPSCLLTHELAGKFMIRCLSSRLF